ncbi:hypothetical protein [Virgibacillus sp. JSM 102003]|uniref:hypothetical protein n=1 Tax=Virgibacillus sp. JSM 102003 TaxID=1562108 RepID=UPI0035C0B10A
MEKSIGVMTLFSAISAVIVAYEIATMNTLMPTFTEGRYYYFIISSIVFLLVAIVMNKGLNKWIKIVMYSYLAIAVLYIIAIIGVFIAIIGGG